MIGTTTAPAGTKSSFAGFVLAAGGPVVANDLRSEARFTPAPLIEELAVVRGIATVVRGCRGEPLGVLACHSRDQDAFSENDTTSLQAIADILSVGLLRRHETDRFEALVKNSADLIAVIDKKGEVRYCNAGAFRIFGRAPATLLGKSLWDFLHPDDHDAARKAFATAVSRPGAQILGSFRLSTAEGAWSVLEGTGTNCMDDPSVRGLVINARDVTERTNLTRVLRTLSAGNTALVGAPDEASLLAGVCRAIVDQGGFPLAWVGYRHYDDAKTVEVMASAGLMPNLPEGARVTWGDDDYGQGVVGKAIRTSQAQTIDDLAIAPEFAPWRETAESASRRSVCAFALRLGSETIGAIAIYAAEPGTFGAEERALLAELAEDLSYGIGRLRDAASLKASEERFRALASDAPIGIIETSSSGKVQFANTRAAEIVGRSLEGMSQDNWLKPVCPEDLPRLLDVRERVHEGEKAAVAFKIRRPGGEVRHLRAVVAPKGQGPGGGLVVTLEDVTDEVLAHEALAYQASHDPLTGLSNRAMFLDTLQKELARQQRGGPGLAVLFLDIDHFKQVNDSLGHMAGDEVLRQVAKRFLHGTRRADSVARLSGDEFVAITYGVRRFEDAAKAAKRLYGLLEKPIRVAGHELRLTASTGIVLPALGADAITVLRDADAAMYRAKAEGRGRWAMFNDELHLRSTRRLALEAELHTALARREFEVHYQPLVAATKGLPDAAEALVRWNSPSRGLVPPAEFIPVAEDSGLIRPIGKFVLERAASQLAAWDSRSGAPRLSVLSVNFSARQLDDPTTPDFVRRTLKRHGVDPKRLCIEVTESVLMAESAATRRSLEAFRELGLPVAIDDFGTGYSSLAYLHALPVTTVKIDRSFVERLSSDSGASAIVKAIVEMGHALGLNVVAEGVSDRRLQELVAGLGCDTAQGFYWTKPLPPEDFANWWRNNNPAGGN
jgi:diguanylate cyclase (GGDEF)-like protein/PAS domain S-box-containing protein